MTLFASILKVEFPTAGARIWMSSLLPIDTLVFVATSIWMRAAGRLSTPPEPDLRFHDDPSGSLGLLKVCEMLLLPVSANDVARMMALSATVAFTVLST